MHTAFVFPGPTCSMGLQLPAVHVLAVYVCSSPPTAALGPGPTSPSACRVHVNTCEGKRMRRPLPHLLFTAILMRFWLLEVELCDTPGIYIPQPQQRSASGIQQPNL